MTVQTVSHFEITEKLGEGGAGVVYKARDVVLDRYVALKFLSPHLLESEDALRRFRTEARLISTLDHQNIETIYEVGEQDGRHFLVLEYLPGGPLGSKIRDVGDVGRKLSLRQVVDSALQIAEGLAYAHRKGIIHRDLKPANILCTQERKVKITDFGLAKYVLGEDTSTSGVLKGTLPYMSPEQVRGITLDHRTDIYSFGVLLHEMTTGERPFRGPNEAAILHAILDDPIPSLRKLRPEAPRELDSLARRAMAKDREQRYQRMEDVIAELTAIREEYFPGPDGLETTTVTDPGISDGPRPGISLPRKAIAVAALLLAAAGGLGWKLWPWPQRCLMAPDFFASCALPTEKHIGILEPEILGASDEDRAYLQGLETMMTARLRRVAYENGATGIHKVENSSGLNLVFRGVLKPVDGSVRVAGTLFNPVSGLRLKEFEFEAGRGELYPLQNELLSRLAEVMGMRPPNHDELSVPFTGTAIRGAFEACLRGMGFLDNDDPEELDRAIEQFESAVRLDRFYAPALAGLGEAYRRKSGVEQEERYRDMAVEYSTQAIGHDAGEAAAHHTLGLVRFGSREYGKAVAALKTALALDPLSTEVRGDLARAYEALENLEQAQATYEEGVRLRPGCWFQHNSLGYYYYRYNKLEPARQCFERVTQLAPDRAKGYNNLGGVFAGLHNWPRAAEMFRQALTIKHSASSASNLGTILFRQEHYREAAEWMAKALDLGEERPDVASNLGEAYLKVPDLKYQAKGAFARSNELAEEALAHDPSNHQLLGMMASNYARLGDYNRAIERIKLALDLAPANVDVLYKAAVVYAMAGRQHQALDNLEAALRGGFPRDEVCKWQPLSELRQDPRFQRLMPEGCGTGTDQGVALGNGSAPAVPAETPPG